jgi:hypothetical protein
VHRSGIKIADEVLVYRDLLQLHHVHGGEQRGDHHHDPQLSPQAGRHSRDACLGKPPHNITIDIKVERSLKLVPDPAVQRALKG